MNNLDGEALKKKLDLGDEESREDFKLRILKLDSETVTCG